MSEAKDTVMGTIQIHNKTGVDLTETGQWERLRPILEAQAEVSFKLGQESRCGWHKPLALISVEAFNDGKQAGRREVVEWIGENSWLDVDDETSIPNGTRGFDDRDWQDQRKEWGLKEG